MAGEGVGAAIAPRKKEPMDNTKALLMLSGGPDSATLASFVHRELPAGAQVAAVYLRGG
jgi:tRNA(Ile)-lysidine synthase TilS/MesJ